MKAIFTVIPKRKAQSRIFNADFIAGPLLVAESRKIAQLLLEDIDDNAWHRAIVVDNILQKKNPEIAKRQARLIRNRLSLMTSELWRIIVDGTAEVATQALLAASIKQSRLIGDFLFRVVKQRLQIFDNKLDMKNWERFLDECEQIEPSIADWTESTRKKLGTTLFKILAEARYLDNTRSKRVTPIFIADELRKYLIHNNEQYVLNCMEIDR